MALSHELLGCIIIVAAAAFGVPSEKLTSEKLMGSYPADTQCTYHERIPWAGGRYRCDEGTYDHRTCTIHVDGSGICCRGGDIYCVGGPDCDTDELCPIQYEKDGGKNYEESCWEKCGKKSGNCEWCGDYTPLGTHMACCRASGDWEWYDKNAPECEGRGPVGYHACYWPADAGDKRGPYPVPPSTTLFYGSEATYYI